MEQEMDHDSEATTMDVPQTKIENDEPSQDDTVAPPQAKGNGQAAEGDGKPAEGPSVEQRLRNAMVQATLIFGQVVSIFLQSPRHHHLLLADLEWRVIPAIALKQYRLVQHKGLPGGLPGGFVSWALVNEEVEAQLQRPDFRLRLQDWKSGERVWIVDVAGPAEKDPALLDKLTQEFFPGREVKVRPGALPAAPSQNPAEAATARHRPEDSDEVYSAGELS